MQVGKQLELVQGRGQGVDSGFDGVILSDGINVEAAVPLHDKRDSTDSRFNNHQFHQALGDLLVVEVSKQLLKLANQFHSGVSITHSRPIG